MAGRIQVRAQLKAVVERERFAQLPRQAGRILRATLQRAVPKKLNHLAGDLLQETIEELR